MKTPYLTATAARTFATLTAGLEPGHARKIDNGHGYMAVHVENLGRGAYSIAHYYEQNGDLMADPDMMFRDVDGVIVPVEITQAPVGRYRQFSSLREISEAASFAGQWLANIASQQGL